MKTNVGEEIEDDLLRKSLLDYIKLLHYNLMLQAKLELLSRIFLTKWEGTREASSQFMATLENAQEDHSLTIQ